MAESPWWVGVVSDHLYETCPARKRSLPELQRAGWDRQGRGTVDPLGTDICGWCRRVWIARNRDELPPVVTVEIRDGLL